MFCLKKNIKKKLLQHQAFIVNYGFPISDKIMTSSMEFLRYTNTTSVILLALHISAFKHVKIKRDISQQNFKND